MILDVDIVIFCQCHSEERPQVLPGGKATAGDLENAFETSRRRGCFPIAIEFLDNGIDLNRDYIKRYELDREAEIFCAKIAVENRREIQKMKDLNKILSVIKENPGLFKLNKWGGDDYLVKELVELERLGKIEYRNGWHVTKP